MAEPPKIAPLQLFLVPNDSDWHTQNEEGEINRWNVTDESTDGFNIDITLEKAIHGEGDNLLTFVGIRFGFHGASEKRRFKSVAITVRFEDETRPLQDDPEVLSIWPDGEFVWSWMSKEIQDTRSAGGSLGGGAAGATASVNGQWQRQETFVRDTAARLYGRRALLKRKAGSHKNAVIIRMSENTQEGRGVLRDLRAGILLARKHPDARRFKAYFSLKVEADMRYDVVHGLKKLVGASHVTDPVIFEPGTNYLDRDDVAGINGEPPSADMVDKYGQAASWTELVGVSKKITKEDGKWHQVQDGDASG